MRKFFAFFIQRVAISESSGDQQVEIVGVYKRLFFESTSSDKNKKSTSNSHTAYIFIVFSATQWYYASIAFFAVFVGGASRERNLYQLLNWIGKRKQKMKSFNQLRKRDNKLTVAIIIRSWLSRLIEAIRVYTEPLVSSQSNLRQSNADCTRWRGNSTFTFIKIIQIHSEKFQKWIRNFLFQKLA